MVIKRESIFSRRSLSTYGWYTGTPQAPPSNLTTTIISDLLPLLLGGIVNDGGTHGGSVTSTSISSSSNTDLTSFLGSKPYDNSRPKAYLNWMVVDEEFNLVSSPNHSGVVQLPLISAGAQKAQMLGPTGLVIRRNGYLYVYLSNESAQDVFFDNLTIQHRRGPVVEQHDYYAFGLEIPGLSTQANKYQYNPDRYKYNGKELQVNEFMDGTGPVWDDYGARMYEPEIARWMVNDPHSEKYANYTSYNYCLDNPTNNIDPDGKDAILIAYPDYKIEAYGTKWSNLGHAGVLLIDNRTGTTKYYEYGRYDAAQKGLVRSVKVSNVKIGKNGKPTVESLNKVLKELSQKSGQNGKIRGAYIISNEYDKMKEYADTKLAENNDPQRKSYSLSSNNCGTFAQDVVDQDDDVKQPSIWWPSPNNIVGNYVDEGNAEVKYDPKTGSTIIGEGNESEAKKSGDKKSTSSSNTSGSGLSWEQAGALIGSWLQQNPNIKITIL